MASIGADEKRKTPAKAEKQQVSFGADFTRIRAKPIQSIA